MEARRQDSIRAKRDGSTHADLETRPRHTGKPSGGPSGIQAKHLKGWLAASNRGKLAAENGEEKTEEEE